MMLSFLPAVIATFASEGTTSFLWREQYNRSDWFNVDLTHLSGPIKDLKFSFSNWLLNSQLQEPLMGSCQLQGLDLGSSFPYRR